MMTLFTRLCSRNAVLSNALHHTGRLSYTTSKPETTISPWLASYVSHPYPSSKNTPRLPKNTWWRSWLLKMAGGTLLGIMVVGVFLFYDNRAKLRSVDLMISKGNCADIDPNEFVKQTHRVDRSDVINQIIEWFVSSRTGGEDNNFGVILGPTGTGKTYSIKEACFKSPKGTLYFEVGGVHEFPTVLARAVGMRIEPTVSGVLFGKYFPSFCWYYQLPTDYDESIDFVIRTISERGEVYRRKYGSPPCLIIDGADLIAKYNDSTFTRLVNLAKKYGNESKLRIIIIPLINDTSSNSRCMVMEVLDLGKSEGVDYLMKCGLNRESGDRIVKSIGSRIIFLKRAVEFYFKSKCDVEEEKVNPHPNRCFSKHRTK